MIINYNAPFSPIENVNKKQRVVYKNKKIKIKGKRYLSNTKNILYKKIKRTCK